MTADLLVGLDVGTSAVDACAFTLSGIPVAMATVPLTVRYPRFGWAEQDAAMWMQAALSALRGLSARLGRDARAVAAIGLTGQCPSVTLADDAGVPLTPGIIYQDNRATVEAARLARLLGPSPVARRAGMAPTSFHGAPKAMWLGAHQPEARERRPWLAQPRDLVAHGLTGAWGTDATHAGCTLLYDLSTGAWADDWAAALDLAWLRLPPILPAAAPLGRLARDVALQTGLPADLLVVMGAADNFCADLGLGAIVPGLLGDSSGTSTCLDLTIVRPDVPGDTGDTGEPDAPRDDPALSLYAHFLPDLLFASAGLNATGVTIAWAAAMLAGGDVTRLEAMAASAPPVVDAPLLLPYLAGGERTDAAAVGAWHGLSLAHDSARLARSVYEGLAFALRELIDGFRLVDLPIVEARLAGGGSRGAFWNGLKADVWGLPVRACAHADATALGAAMLAGVAMGVYRDLGDATARGVRLGPEHAPDRTHAALYAELYGRWRALKARGGRPATEAAGAITISGLTPGSDHVDGER